MRRTVTRWTRTASRRAGTTAETTERPMILSRSLSRKLVATLFGMVGFVLLYEVTIIDSQYAARQEARREQTAEPAPGAHLRFTATAYCKGDVTSSGVAPHTGIAAADPDLLPVGSVIELTSIGEPYAGIYTIMDTGPMVKGRELDLYMWSCSEAMRFGRQQVHVTVLRLGWNPRATTPGLLDKLFPRGSRAKEPVNGR
jgi:3D (Asp-Asp-Asp) domain-containing protein